MSVGLQDPQGRPLHLEKLSVLARARRPASRWGVGEQARLQGHPATCNSSAWADAGRGPLRLPAQRRAGPSALFTQRHSGLHTPACSHWSQAVLVWLLGPPILAGPEPLLWPTGLGRRQRESARPSATRGRKRYKHPHPLGTKGQVSTSLQGSLEGAGVLGGVG